MINGLSLRMMRRHLLHYLLPVLRGWTLKRPNTCSLTTQTSHLLALPGIQTLPFEARAHLHGHIGSFLKTQFEAIIIITPPKAQQLPHKPARFHWTRNAGQFHTKHPMSVHDLMPVANLAKAGSVPASSSLLLATQIRHTQETASPALHSGTSCSELCLGLVFLNTVQARAHTSPRKMRKPTQLGRPCSRE
jgi:hypothetical protein